MKGNQGKSFCFPQQDTTGNDTWCQHPCTFRRTWGCCSQAGRGSPGSCCVHQNIDGLLQDGHDEHQEHELHWHIVHAYNNEGKLLDKLKVNAFKTPPSELTDITVNHFAIKHAQEQVSYSSKPVDAIHHDKCQGDCTSHYGDGHTPPVPSRDCPNCTWHHPTSKRNCPTRDSRCSKYNKMGHWELRCHGGKPPPPKNAPLTESQCGMSRCLHGSCSCCPGRGGKTDAIDVGEELSPQDEVVLCGIQMEATAIATTYTNVNIGEISTHSTEMFTKVMLSAPSGMKYQEADIQVKVDTGAGGNVLLLHLFCEVYLEWVNFTGASTGLKQTSVHLCTYNGIRIPQHGALDT